MTDNTRVFAIIVTYNPNMELFRLVYDSIVSQVDSVIVVDNASVTPVDSLVVVEESKVDLIGLTGNIGLAAAQNIAISKAHAQGASHIILFDQDSVVGDGFIEALCECEQTLIASGKKVAAVGPSFFDPQSNQLYPATVYIGPFIKRVPIGDAAIRATYIIASGCLIRMNVLDDVGLMKDELFIDYIDVEWSLRAQAKGYGVYISPKARMAHTIGDRRLSICGRTISVHSPLRRYFLVRNSFLMLRLNYVPWGYKLRELVFNFIRTGIGFYTATQKLVFCKYFIMALRDGLLGRFGPCPKTYK